MMMKILNDMENIEDFKRENKDFLLHHSFQEQKELRGQYNVEIEYTIKLMKNYLHDVQHVREQNMDVAIISHLTYNLNHQLLQCYYRSDEFYGATYLYLTGDDDEKNYKYLEEFQKYGNDIKELIENFDQISLFEIYQSRMSIVFKHPILELGIEGKNASLLKLERELAYMNGVQLVKCLVYLIGFMEKRLVSIKNGCMFEPDEELEYVYDLNYVYYADNYWDKKHFRHRVETNELLGEVTIDGLTSYYREIVRDFKTNKIGETWDANYDNRGQIAYELLRLSINSDQWEYFFKNIFAIEELRRWINELKNPKFQQSGGTNSIPSEKDGANDASSKIVMLFSDGTLNVDEPSQLYFLMLAMWARRLLQSKEITSFVRMVGDAYPTLFNTKRTTKRAIMSLQNMNTKTNKYFDVLVKDQATMIEYIDLMYPKTKKGKRRKECERAVNLATQLFLKLK